MNRRTDISPRTWMAATVLTHLAISVAHGAAHSGAQVQMSPAATAFVVIVILAGPLVGVALSWRSAQLGSLVVATTMAGSLVFGVVNHFVLASPDHVAHVAGPWQVLFGITAALLAVTEGLGLWLAIRLARGPSRRPGHVSATARQ